MVELSGVLLGWLSCWLVVWFVGLADFWFSFCLHARDSSCLVLSFCNIITQEDVPIITKLQRIHSGNGHFRSQILYSQTNPD